MKKGYKKAPSAAAGSANAIPSTSTEDVQPKDSMIVHDEVFDSEIIPPTQPDFLKLSWLDGNVETISVSSSHSEICTYCHIIITKLIIVIPTYI